MVDMKGAVKAAIAFVEEFFPGAKDIRLEAVEPDGSFWSVVISFRSGEPGILSEVMVGESRLFKTIEIDVNSGLPHAMKTWAA